MSAMIQRPGNRNTRGTTREFSGRRLNGRGAEGVFSREDRPLDADPVASRDDRGVVDKRAMLRAMVRVADFPQLKLLAWSLRPDAELEDGEALALYESGWRFIEPGSLTPEERALIDRLVRTVGNGVLNV